MKPPARRVRVVRDEYPDRRRAIREASSGAWHHERRNQKAEAEMSVKSWEKKSPRQARRSNAPRTSPSNSSSNTSKQSAAACKSPFSKETSARR